MSKIGKAAALLACLVLFAALGPGAAAAEDGGRKLAIETTEDFLAFAENCRLDSYSWGMTVSLNADIDLSGTDFQGVPIFCGTFQGNEHTISGVEIDREGSYQGLFRYLTETAVVRRLHVEGRIEPRGSRMYVGGLAGSSAGQILYCTFDGHVTGGDTVGGLVGINEMTGVVENCRVSGVVSGSHYAGGLVGENFGVIRSSSNAAEINTTPQQNTVELDEITVETIAGTESANTVTDVGGVAGVSSGVIRDCNNRGAVGYRQMGYNIGGIAGTQTGYIFGCENFGTVSGRKEVGGIVGQLEPVHRVEYSEDMLQLLREQLDEMSGLAGQAAAHAQGGVANVGRHLSVLGGQVEDASEAVYKLLEDSGYDGGIPDPDTLLAIENSLTASLTDMAGTLGRVSSAVSNMAGAIAGDMQALTGYIDKMGETIDNAADTMGITFVDVSDEDTAELVSAKVENCRNRGDVVADLNAGGIVGAISLPNDAESVENLEFIGEQSFNLENKLRAVILSCRNSGDVCANKQHAGGIVGWASMGLARECLNTGTVDADSADYVGGIAGRSSGFIRSCDSCCSVFGSAWVGGIAGSGTVVTDCRSMVAAEGAEKLGAVLGFAEAPTPIQTGETPAEDAPEEEEPALRGNYYLPLEEDIGAVDGISYEAAAQPMERDAFMKLDALPAEFRTVVVSFVCDERTVETISLVSGGTLKESQLPAVPEKAGYTACWEGLEEADLQHVVQDITFTAKYEAKNETIQTDTLRDNGMPVLLAQGLFSGEQTVVVTPREDFPPLQYGEEAAESWKVSFPNGGTVEKLRYALPQGSKAEAIRLMLRQENGEWRECGYSVEGSYLVFVPESGETELCLINSPDYILTGVLCGGAVLILLMAIILRLRARKNKE